MQFSERDLLSLIEPALRAIDAEIKFVVCTAKPQRAVVEKSGGSVLLELEIRAKRSDFDANAALDCANANAFEDAFNRVQTNENTRRGKDYFLREPLAVFETRCASAIIFVYEHRTHTLRTCAQFSYSCFGESRTRRLIIAMQILQAVTYAHEKGYSFHGSCGLENFVIVDEEKEGFDEKTLTPLIEIAFHGKAGRRRRRRQKQGRNHSNKKSHQYLENRDEEYKDDASELDRRNLRGLTAAWRIGAISNLEYISRINVVSGRKVGDFRFHAFMPWVIDFSKHPFANENHKNNEDLGNVDGANNNNDEKDDDKPLFGYRDLSKTKARLMKGDEMLDKSFDDFGFHLVDDPALSELGACVQSARNLSKFMLCRYVRPDWDPNEYPKSIERIFETTPDECLPRFYYDPTIFTSTLSSEDGLQNLEVPKWVKNGDAEEFIRIHRSCLESDSVSKRLHKWIDLHFGYQVGNASNPHAVFAKNTCKFGEDVGKLLEFGRMKVFRYAHPQRRTKNSPLRSLSFGEEDDGQDDDDEHEDLLRKYRDVSLNDSFNDDHDEHDYDMDDLSNAEEDVVNDLRALGAALFTVFTGRDIPEHLREIRERALVDSLGAFVDIEDALLENDAREELRYLFESDDANEIPSVVKDFIEKLIFDEIPPSANEILKLDCFDAETLMDLINIRNSTKLGSIERIVACDELNRLAKKNMSGKSFQNAVLHATIVIEESMHAIACCSKIHIEKYSRRSMERAMASSALFQSCADYLSALNLQKFNASKSSYIVTSILQKPAHLAKYVLLKQYCESLELGANEEISDDVNHPVSAKEYFQRINEEGPSFRRELLHQTVASSIASAVGSDFDFDDKMIPSLLTIVASSREDVNDEELNASLLVLERIVMRLSMAVLLRLVIAPLIMIISCNRNSDKAARAKQAIEMIRVARRIPAHLDIARQSQFYSSAASTRDSQKNDIKKIKRKDSREIALLSLERYVSNATGDVNDENSLDQKELDASIKNTWIKGPWRFLPVDVVQPASKDGYFRDESPWVVRLETLAKWRAHSRGFGVDARKSSIDMPANVKMYSRSTLVDDANTHNNTQEFFDGNSSLRVSEAETRVLTCGAHYRSGLRRGTSIRVWRISNSPKVSESSYTQFRAPFAIHEPDANIRAGCFLDPRGETIATADDAGYLRVWQAKFSSNTVGDSLFDDFEDENDFSDDDEIVTNDVAENVRTMWRSRDKTLTARRDGFSCLAHDSNLNYLVAGTLRGSITITDCESGAYVRSHTLADDDVRGTRSIEVEANNIFCSYGNGSVTAIDVRTCKSSFLNFKAHDDKCTRVRCIEKTQQFITSSIDGTVKIWDSRKIERSAMQIRSYYIDDTQMSKSFKNRVPSYSINDFDVIGKSCFVATNSQGIGIIDVDVDATEDDAVKLETRPIDHDKNNTIAIQILPRSHLFVVLSDDGVVRVCR